MKRICAVAIILSVFAVTANAQSVTFDFDTAPLYTPFPIDLTVADITAHFSGNPAYYNYSIQRADVLGFTPSGFAGNCIYPNTIYPCDLLISFNRALTNISIMYAPEEYATESSCTMRMTAYFGSKLVGTNTHNINPRGTWPSGVLSLTANQPFNQVVIHYDKPPPTGGDYGPIFMADNLVVTVWTAPYVRIDSVATMSNGHIMLQGAGTPFATVTVQATPDLKQQFTFLGTAVVAGDGSFQFEDTAPVFPSRFYRVVYP